MRGVLISGLLPLWAGCQIADRGETRAPDNQDLEPRIVQTEAEPLEAPPPSAQRASISYGLSVPSPKRFVHGHVLVRERLERAWPAPDLTGEAMQDDVDVTKVRVEGIVRDEWGSLVGGAQGSSKILVLYDLAEVCPRPIESSVRVACAHRPVLPFRAGTEVLVVAGLRPIDPDHPASGLPWTVAMWELLADGSVGESSLGDEVRGAQRATIERDVQSVLRAYEPRVEGRE